MLNPGTHVGPYEVLSLLGAGGMGEVYRARDPRLGRDVAIKVLPARLAGNRNTRSPPFSLWGTRRPCLSCTAGSAVPTQCCHREDAERSEGDDADAASGLARPRGGISSDSAGLLRPPRGGSQ